MAPARRSSGASGSCVPVKCRSVASPSRLPSTVRANTYSRRGSSVKRWRGRPGLPRAAPAAATTTGARWASAPEGGGERPAARSFGPERIERAGGDGEGGEGREVEPGAQELRRQQHPPGAAGAQRVHPREGPGDREGERERVGDGDRSAPGHRPGVDRERERHHRRGARRVEAAGQRPRRDDAQRQPDDQHGARRGEGRAEHRVRGRDESREGQRDEAGVGRERRGPAHVEVPGDPGPVALVARRGGRRTDARKAQREREREGRDHEGVRSGESAHPRAGVSPRRPGARKDHRRRAIPSTAAPRPCDNARRAHRSPRTRPRRPRHGPRARPRRRPARPLAVGVALPAGDEGNWALLGLRLHQGVDARPRPRRRLRHDRLRPPHRRVLRALRALVGERLGSSRRRPSSRAPPRRRGGARASATRGPARSSRSRWPSTPGRCSGAEPSASPTRSRSPSRSPGPSRGWTPCAPAAPGGCCWRRSSWAPGSTSRPSPPSPPPPARSIRSGPNDRAAGRSPPP